MTTQPDNLGLKIKALRDHHRMSLSALARGAEVSKGHLSEIESGGCREPGVYLIARIAMIFGVTVDDLIGMEIEPLTVCPTCKGDGWIMGKRKEGDEG